MKIGRRGFLKILGGTAAAAVASQIITPPTVAAPLFVPAQNLDMGVPRKILTATEMPATTWEALGSIRRGSGPLTAPYRGAGSIEMTLLQAEFSFEYGGGRKLPAGTTLLVDAETAERWVTNGVAVPGPHAPPALQIRSAKDQAARAKAREAQGTIWDLLVIESDFLPENTLTVVSGHKIERAVRFDPVAAMVASVERSMARRARGPIEYDETWEID